VTFRRAALFLSAVISAALVAGCTAAPQAPRNTTSSQTHQTTTTTHITTPPATISPPTTEPATQRLTAIAFFNPTDGYGVFTREDYNTCQDLVGRANNDDSIFGPLVLVTSWTCGASGPSGSLAFDDHGDGFLYGPDLWITHDGGTTWQQSIQPGSVLSVEALGSSVWMEEAQCSPTSNATSCPVLLFLSNNGGRTWTPAHVPSGATASPYLGGGVAGQTWLVRVSQNAAYLLSAPPMTTNGVQNDPTMWFTSDNGAFWSTRSVRCGMGAMSVALSAAPDGTLLAVCASEPGAGNQLKSSTRSTNGGITWTVENSCPFSSTGPMTNCADANFSTGYLGGIDAVSANTVFLYGDRNSLFVTRDGGVTWEPEEPLIGDTSGGTEQAIFFNTSDGIVLGQNGSNDDITTLWRTSDGGAHWTLTVPHGYV
jgi:hypothetical protein